MLSNTFGSRQSYLPQHTSERAELEAWVRLRKRLMRSQELIADLEQALANTAMTGPGNKYRRKVLTKTIDYFRQNASAMNYRALRTRISNLQWSRRGPCVTSSVFLDANALAETARGRPAAPLHPVNVNVSL